MPKPDRPRILVLGAHPRHGLSMLRYTALLQDSYAQLAETTHDVETWRPIDVLSRRLPVGPARKIAVYVEELVLFPLRLTMRLRPTDAVHVADHSDAPWLWSVQTAAPTRITCHDLIAVRSARGEIPEWRTRLSGRIYQRLILSGLRRAGTIVSVSDDTAGHVARLAPRAARATVHNPIDAAVLARPAALPQDDTPFALLVAPSVWRKSRGDSLRAWRRLREASGGPLRLIVVGDPITEQERQQSGLSQQLLDAIEIYRYVEDDELADLYRRCEALISFATHEGFGWPLVEANAAGRIAVCSDIAAHRETNPHNVVVDSIDDADWAGVLAAVRDPERRAAAARYVERYSPARFSQALRDLPDSGEFFGD